jgi:hypothetical protein
MSYKLNSNIITMKVRTCQILITVSHFSLNCIQFAPGMSVPRITFNNQNTVLLSMILPSDANVQDQSHENMLCLLHDNRIFSFKKDFIDGTRIISLLSTQYYFLLFLL